MYPKSLIIFYNTVWTQQKQPEIFTLSVISSWKSSIFYLSLFSESGFGKAMVDFIKWFKNTEIGSKYGIKSFNVILITKQRRVLQAGNNI